MPFCPSIINLSGRQPGQPATELGLARIASPDFPSIIANYSNQFADGRPVKSTSIGIKDEDGKYVAALCLNVDMTLFRGMQSALARFTETENSPIKEHIDPGSNEVTASVLMTLPLNARRRPEPLNLKTVSC